MARSRFFFCINYLGSRFDKISPKEMAIWPFDTIKCVRWNSPAELFLRGTWIDHISSSSKAGQTWAYCAPRAIWGEIEHYAQSLHKHHLTLYWKFYPVFSLLHSLQFKIQRVQLFFRGSILPLSGVLSQSALCLTLQSLSSSTVCVLYVSNAISRCQLF